MSSGHERITIREIGDRRRVLFPPIYESQIPWEIHLAGTSLVHCDLCPKERDEPCQIACYTQKTVVVE